MAAVTAQVAFDTARAFLNDDAGSLWTNAVLLPKLVEAFRELESKLRINAAEIVISMDVQNVIANATSLAITDIIEPIILHEKVPGSGDDTYVKMTEYDSLPNKLPATTLRYWQWDGTLINFIPSSATRTVKTKYWRTLTEPTSGASSLIFINAEYYLAARTAALAAGSVGEAEIMQACSAIADDSLNNVIQANRGRQAPPASTRP